MAYTPPMADCLVCAKHRGEGWLKGQLVALVERFWIYHLAHDDDTAPLG